MGSPYEITVSKNTIHVIKTKRGFEKILSIISTSAGQLGDSWIDCHCYRDPLDAILMDFFKVALDTVKNRAQCVVTLSPRYDWTGSTRFSRTIFLDFTVKRSTSQEEDAITRESFRIFLADYVRKGEE